MSYAEICTYEMYDNSWHIPNMSMKSNDEMLIRLFIEAPLLKH